ncbi:M12 family metallo-peptidase, partial [uncultured Algibacter sp.]|uniref:M12 family metallo-peptidase n=1 Tax=uncultured Algibacter sp. TaxID=298659 RepID=UPI0032174ED9
FLVDDGTGKLVEVDKGPERVYTGHVVEHPNFEVSAVMTDRGLMATIDRLGGDLLEISPSASDRRHHKISKIKRFECGTSGCNIKNNSHTEKNHTELNNITHTKLIPSNDTRSLKNTTNSSISKMAASRRPTTVMDVLEFEIGVEIGSRAFFATTAYNGNLATAQASAQSIIGNLNLRYLRGAGIKHTLGTVIIRTNASTDPLRNTVTGTGTSSTASSSLTAFKDYWNNNPSEVGNTHDLAVYHVLSRPSGLAYVNAVGSIKRYGTMGGNGSTSWANGTAVHEVGHLWSLAHNDSSGLFYESKPRNNAGSNAAGGEDIFISVMNGSGRRNIGRLATNEAKRVINARNSKRSFGDLNRNPDPVNPFGVFDQVERPKNSNAVMVLDVIANDYDVNNDVLDVRLLDAVSQKGGTISLSSG